MVSIKTTGLAAAAALATLAQADYEIDPTTVPISTRGKLRASPQKITDDAN